METATAILIVGSVIAVAVVLVLVELLRRSAKRRSKAERELEEQHSAELAAARQEAASIREEAQREADELRAHAQAETEQAEQHVDEINSELGEKRLDLEQREARLGQREARLHVENRALESRQYELSRQEAAVAAKLVELEELENSRQAELARVAGLTPEDAKKELVEVIEGQAKREAAIKARDIEREATEQAQARAREIITLAIQRLASEQTAEAVVSVLNLPGDEMKGRIIGREGRNIRAFEQITGVNVIIDDTPEAVLLSCFDPVRREIARMTLEELVLDGRIHPHRIEEQYHKSKAEVENVCQRAGEDALVEMGISDVHPDLVALLGRLRYRMSYGQNVLQHLLESAHLAGIMAAELGLDVQLAKRCGLLHDIGKALTHEVEGSHALIGAEVARRYGESDDVVHAIEAHHNEVEVRSVEAVLTQAADAISGSRPGARRESLEAYVKRLERLEEIAMAQEGVEKVFAMQAGREVRVMVQPDEVDDLQAQVLARDIAKQVEEELTYPGQIRITVVRESRASEFAR
ncbi:ribonuclease Y [Actinobacteria bacterium YIM 96077]|uniref:Ribonuclease Y n=1 Tax=Phytoactinopolyspora halophila TaxID=1981511 RepID=A0A329QYJ4_9ACTN|nr:ribonuclease Y [Phytoactinopolyspora halophila]AYY12815.1 ribonuclease Y [Actinobacteria bacterium YIM 96077]RAW16392.1 ribonuclease Y [Phytoactinopolyspora halophila]